MIADRAPVAAKLRKTGTSEGRLALKAFLAKQTDWTATCRRCGTHLEGTLQQLREHKCGSPSPTNP